MWSWHPLLVSSWRRHVGPTGLRHAVNSPTTVTRRIRRRGEHEISRKTIACGNAGCSGGPVVTTLVCVTTLCARGCGCSGHPAFPTPSVGRKIHAQLGRIAPRDRGGADIMSRVESGSEIVRCIAARLPGWHPHHILHKYQACTASPWPFRADVLSRDRIFSTATQTDRTPPDRLRRWRFFAHELFVLQRKDRLRA